MFAFLYSLVIRLYGVAISVAALFNPKARAWVQGRTGLLPRLKAQIDESESWIWIHAASLGEFEQGRPLIDALHSDLRSHRILLTFFSPSGYTVRHDYASADVVTYMPLDTRRNASQFVDIVQPRLVIFIKYEIWYNHLSVLLSRRIPVILISAQFRPSQVYFAFPGRALRKMLRRLDKIFVANKPSALLLREYGFGNIAHAGDTRIDRVLATTESHSDFGWLKECLGSAGILVAGSTWPADEEVLLPWLHKSGMKCVIAPHEITSRRVQELKGTLPGNVSLLSAIRNEPQPCDCVVVDSMGELSSIYHIATVAYVGGGFGNGIHNVLEPAAFGIPVIIGPRYEKFEEAVALKEAGALRVVHNAKDLEKVVKEVTAEAARKRIEEAINAFMELHRGATLRIYDYIRGKILRRNGLDDALPQ